MDTGTNIRNQARHLDEWILYHYIFGFDHLFCKNFVFPSLKGNLESLARDDHGSEDNTSAVVESYIQFGLVTRAPTAINTSSDDTEGATHCYDGSVIPVTDMEWVANINIDESLVPSLVSRIQIDSHRPTPIQKLLEDWTCSKTYIIQLMRISMGTNSHIKPPSWPTLQADAYTNRRIDHQSGSFWPKIRRWSGTLVDESGCTLARSRIPDPLYIASAIPLYILSKHICVSYRFVFKLDLFQNV